MVAVAHTVPLACQINQRKAEQFIPKLAPEIRTRWFDLATVGRYYPGPHICASQPIDRMRA